MILLLSSFKYLTSIKRLMVRQMSLSKHFSFGVSKLINQDHSLIQVLAQLTGRDVRCKAKLEDDKVPESSPGTETTQLLNRTVS